MKHVITFTLLILLSAFAGKAAPFKILQFNIWQEGTVVKGGFEAIADEIARLEPDAVALCEIRNYNGQAFIPKLLEALEKRGKKYYGGTSKTDSDIITKQKPFSQKNIGDFCQKTKIRIADKTLTLYATHLDWLNCSYYLPRGYNSCTWKKLDTPELNADSILKDNLASQRDEAIAALILDTEKEKNNPVFICGDFNEPSHLDWQENTRNMRDHHDLTLNWHSSISLTNAGFKDAYREFYPDPVTHPGFTFPSANPDVDIKKLVWAPDADERERIDFVYFRPLSGIEVTDACISGPSGSILKGQSVKNENKDRFILPLHIWPSDHKAVLITFELN